MFCFCHRKPDRTSLVCFVFVVGSLIGRVWRTNAVCLLQFYQDGGVQRHGYLSFSLSPLSLQIRISVVPCLDIKFLFFCPGRLFPPRCTLLGSVKFTACKPHADQTQRSCLITKVLLSLCPLCWIPRKACRHVSPVKRDFLNDVAMVNQSELQLIFQLNLGHKGWSSKSGSLWLTSDWKSGVVGHARVPFSVLWQSSLVQDARCSTVVRSDQLLRELNGAYQ